MTHHEAQAWHSTTFMFGIRSGAANLHTPPRPLTGLPMDDGKTTFVWQFFAPTGLTPTPH